MITLIIPPSPFLLNDKVFVSLGVLYVAAALEQKGHEVRILDLKGQSDWQDKVRKVAGEDNKLIGVTTTSANFPIALEILDIIKSINKNARVIIGGPHATIAPQQCEMFDKVNVGDGVTGIFRALESDEKIIHAEMVKNIDEMPFPARHLIDLDSYYYEIDKRRATNVMSQFGCPYRCAFCCGRNIKEYSTVRFRSPRNFAEELDFLNDRYGYTAFMIHDDEFNLNKKRTLEACEVLGKKDYFFRAFVRPDLFTEEIAEAMGKAGFRQVDVGVESGSARVLKTIQKSSTPEINSRAREVARKYGIRFKAFVTIGHPSETRDDVSMTKQWLIDNRPDAFEIYVVTPYPGALIYDQKEKFDIEFSIDYSRDITSVTRRHGERRCYVSNSHLTSEEIISLREQVDKEVRAELGLLSV